MKEIVKNKWVKALRSGEYDQGKNRLLTVHDNDSKSFCCLGVLCELHAQETGGHWEKERGLKWEYRGQEGVLPGSVMEWSGVSNVNGRATGLNGSLILMNDSGDYDFNQIADLIAKHWREL